jgi:hypothetical protein
MSSLKPASAVVILRGPVSRLIIAVLNVLHLSKSPAWLSVNLVSEAIDSAGHTNILGIKIHV